MGILKFTAPGHMYDYTFLYRISASGVKNRLLLEKAENVKSWYFKNNFYL